MVDELTLFLMFAGAYIAFWIALMALSGQKLLLDMHGAIFKSQLLHINTANERLRLENEDLRIQLRAEYAGEQEATKQITTTH